MPLIRKTHYQILKVQPSASSVDITTAYKQLAREYHPDHNTAPNATHLMQKLNAVYEILRDPERRANYDQKIFGKNIPHKTQIKLYRMGAMAGMLQPLQIVLDGKVIGEITVGTEEIYDIEAGEHTIYVKTNIVQSEIVHFQCRSGETVDVVCGANAALDSLVASMNALDQIYFVKVIKTEQ